MNARDKRAGRVLFVDHTAKLGDSEMMLLDVAVAHRDRGAVALFEDGPFAATLVARNVAVLVLASTRARLTLPRTARAFDLLYANSPRAFLACAATGLIARRPVVWHLRELLCAPYYSALHVRAVVACANARAARVVTSSSIVADAFVSSGGNRALVQVVPDGVDVAPFDRISTDVRAEMRQALGISERAYVVGSFGGAGTAERRVMEDALAQLPGVRPFAVDGAHGDRADLPRLIAACDIVVQMGDVTPASARLMVKVLLSRRPLIVMDAPGVRDVVDHDVTGIVVAPGDADALAIAINRLRDQPIRSDELAFTGATEARRRFSGAAMNASITRLIDEVSSGRTP
jgi:glycosyltransferase involved in cell wall biosynthesis